MSLPNIINASYATREHAANTSDRRFTLGQRMEYEDGRKFRYVLAGGTTLVVGDLIQGKASVSGDVDLAVQSAASIGDTTVSITAQGTAAADFYKDGWMVINKDPGGGYAYKVKSHPVFASATKVITLYTDDPVRVALTTSSETAFVPNTYDAVIQAPITTLTSRLAGVSVTPVTNAQYGWVQTGGVAAVNSAASQIVGNVLYAVLAAAGRVGVGVVDIDEAIGIALTVPTTAGEFGGIFLIMD